MCLNLKVNMDGENQPLTSTFQVADMTRPLMSVSQICENGHRCVFEKNHALVVSAKGKGICRFEREAGLYVCRMKLKAPAPFTKLER